MTESRSHTPGDDLDSLLADLFDGGLTEERWTVLRQLLRDPHQRRRYRRYVRMHALLEVELSFPTQTAPVPGRTDATDDSRPDRMISGPGSISTIRPPRWSWWYHVAAAVLVVALGSFAGMRLLAHHAEPIPYATVSAIEQMTAAPWRTGDRVAQGPLLVPAGILHVIFDSGVDMTVHGPATLALTSPQAVSLQTGALVVRVPAHAIGFRVATPQALVIDLGTEFGVAVTGSGQATVQVRKGRVALSTPAQPESAVLVTGDARHIDPGGLVVQAAADDQLFAFAPLTATPASRWQECLRRLRLDPDLVAWYAATSVPSVASPAPASAPSPSASASASASASLCEVSGPRITDGRFPGTLAWHFSAPNDRIRITVPGRFHALSLFTWIRFDHVGPEATALLTTDGWGNPPLLHWHCQANGLMTLSLCANGSRIWSWHADQPLPRTDGLWHLLGCTVAADGTARFYGDGILLGESRHHIILDAAIGRALIGDWSTNAHDLPQPASNRQLHGTLDGFGILARAMSTSEMVALVSAGRPDLSSGSDSR